MSRCPVCNCLTIDDSLEVITDISCIKLVKNALFSVCVRHVKMRYKNNSISIIRELDMEASITLDFSLYSENITDILKAFQKIGWNIYNSKEEVEYIPIGDDGMYNWINKKCLRMNFIILSPRKYPEMSKSLSTYSTMTVTRALHFQRTVATGFC